ncbi:hypothetical protein FZI95_29765 [Mycobacterium sp. CBMA247]|nr:hypothetical protein [Mycolicibacterium sp. CBMA 329]MUL91676.1 hypothetical protein [Mycolicibacterium sp. CBMA 331]MUM03128.1 hypothetical protein [Mycolicibacterium sp. CBMA 334]MUM29514.1 hypothetical protein [Mycolicibacterium sp. CBMA 295]MUM41971.1 hypothetical protein [Mycolicibacterium sp. CBMA 247]MUM47740.1 hypothetical protein [Mycolicibacterium sp. CBMA 294]
MESHSHRWPHWYNGPVARIYGCGFCVPTFGAWAATSRDRSALGPAFQQGFSVLRGRDADGRASSADPT